MILASALASILLAVAQPDESTDLPEQAPVATAPAQPGAPPPPATQPPAGTPPPTTTTPAPPLEPGASPGPQPYVPPVDAEVGIRAAFQNAENAQGPLDGPWRLVGDDGAGLFLFVLTDTGGAPSAKASIPSNPAIEGAWRDLRREGAVGDSGLLVSVEHIADTVEIRFYEADPTVPTVINLHAAASGVWAGELIEPGGRRAVVMKRF